MAKLGDRGVRKTNWHPDLVRARIRTTQIVKRLQAHCLGELEEMSKTQIQAAGILLRKTLPDLISATVTKNPLEQLREDELISTLEAIRGHLAAQGTGVSAPGGGFETGELATAAELPTVQ